MVATPTGHPSGRASLSWHCLMAAALVGLVAVAFGPALGNDFVGWDDADNLTHNPSYRGLGVEQLEWMFTTTHLGVYQPLGWLTFAVVHVVMGDGPFGYHLVSVGLHAMSAVAVYLLFVRLLTLTSSPSAARSGAIAPVAAAVGAALFAVHPLRVECVAWASAQPYLLAGLLCLLSVLCYLRAAVGKSRWWLSASIVLFALSLTAKAVAVPLPAVLVLLDVGVLRRLSGGLRGWFGRRHRQVWLEKVPYLLLSAGCSWMAVHAGSSDPRAPDYGPAGPAVLPAYVLAFHCFKTVFPVDLLPAYDLPPELHAGQPRYVAAWLFVAGLTVLAFRTRRRHPLLAAAWVCYVLMLMPYLRLVPHVPQVTADRYSYLACVSWAFLAAIGVRAGWRVGPRRVTPLVCVAVVAVLVFLTRQQCATWRDSQTLWTYAGLVDPNSPTALLGLAAVYHADGRSAQAAELAERALSARPTDARGHMTAARALLAIDQADRAERHAREAVRLGAPGGRDKIALAEVLTARGQTAEAARLLDDVARQVGDDLGVLNGLAIAWSRAGQLEPAVDIFERALQLAPRDVSTQRNLGAALFRAGQFERAARIFARLASQDPDDAQWPFYRAESLVGLGMYEQAAAAYARALELAPDDPQSMIAYSWLLSACPDPSVRNGDKALALAESACAAAQPAGARALDCLAAALARCQRYDQAVAATDQAYRMAVQHGASRLAEAILRRKQDYQAGRPTNRMPQLQSD